MKTARRGACQDVCCASRNRGQELGSPCDSVQMSRYKPVFRFRLLLWDMTVGRSANPGCQTVAPWHSLSSGPNRAKKAPMQRKTSPISLRHISQPRTTFMK
ncbi:hypothetical protein NQZ79_g5485 [Umbelopsis isabellina]|nr:hypothetical protein NQZ79_g5485 [Umbelopsis isabellina]